MAGNLGGRARIVASSSGETNVNDSEPSGRDGVESHPEL